MAQVNFQGNQLGAPKWCADFLTRERLVPFPAKLDTAQFSDGLGVRATLTAGALAAATSITVAALTDIIPAGAVLYFGTAGKLARVSAQAAAGAVTIAVDALPNALNSGDVAVYSKYGRKFVPSGTLLGRTFTERDAGTGFGPAVNTDDEIFLVAFDVADANSWNDVELVRNNTVIMENYLPDWTTIAANAPLLAALRARYVCGKGQD